MIPRSRIGRGDTVWIETKADQGTGRLVEGTVLDILTPGETHPRGIKVRLGDGRVGRVKRAAGRRRGAARAAEEPGRTCKGRCKGFRVKRNGSGGRYDAGQAHCQVCDAWIDHRGCHTRDGSPAGEGTVGWFCNCCNYRVRQRPRNRVYKEKFRLAQQRRRAG